MTQYSAIAYVPGGGNVTLRLRSCRSSPRRPVGPDSPGNTGHAAARRSAGARRSPRSAKSRVVVAGEAPVIVA